MPLARERLAPRSCGRHCRKSIRRSIGNRLASLKLGNRSSTVNQASATGCKSMQWGRLLNSQFSSPESFRITECDDFQFLVGSTQPHESREFQHPEPQRAVVSWRNDPKHELRRAPDAMGCRIAFQALNCTPSRLQRPHIHRCQSANEIDRLSVFPRHL